MIFIGFFLFRLNLSCFKSLIIPLAHKFIPIPIIFQYFGYYNFRVFFYLFGSFLCFSFLSLSFSSLFRSFSPYSLPSYKSKFFKKEFCYGYFFSETFGRCQQNKSYFFIFLVLIIILLSACAYFAKLSQKPALV